MFWAAALPSLLKARDQDDSLGFRVEGLWGFTKSAIGPYDRPNTKCGA